MSTATIHRIDRSDQPRSQQIARRLRGYLAEERIPALHVANALGLSQSKLARRMTGDVAFSVDELDQISRLLGISFEWLTTGQQNAPAGPDGPDGGVECAIRDSNPEPADKKHSQVIALATRTDLDELAATA